MSTPRIVSLSIVILLVAGASSAATFVVPADRDFIHRADAIIIGTPLISYSQPGTSAAIETVTSISVEEIIKGSRLGDTIDVVEPGGVFGDQAMQITGVPEFTPGERVLLFLNRTPDNRWAATDLVLGKFAFRTSGPDTLLQRDEAEIVGWDADLTPHREPRRAAAPFLQFVRDEARGRRPQANYLTESPLPSTTETTVPASPSPRFTAQPSFVAQALAFSATSYTMIISGTSGARWNVFPNAVNFFMGATQEPGAPGGGATAIQAAFAAWDNDSGSNVNYVYAGVDSTHTQGLHAADGANTILFERDLSAWGVTPFTCSGSSYGGTLGLGGVTSASGTHTGPNGETFATTKEGDVEMNKGIANCTLLFTNGDWNSAVTHEVGHTLGFRHSDQNRSGGTCTGTAGLECSSAAIMTATVVHGVNGVLQQWDIDAVRAVYPGTTVTPPPPTGVRQKTPADFNGDKISDPYLFRDGAWVNVQTNVGIWTGQQSSACFPAVGDYDGDGKKDFSLYCSGAWFIYNANGTVRTGVWTGGAAGDIPVPADYDGDGKDDMVIYRNGAWIAFDSTTGATKWTVSTGPGSGVVPVPMDYDGDGRADFTVYSHGAWYFYRRDGSLYKGIWTGGVAGDLPVPGDYDGNGVEEPVVFRGGAWMFYDLSTGSVTKGVWTGASSFLGRPLQPTPLDIDGDGKLEFGIYNGGSWVFYNADGTVRVGYWTGGVAGDQPISRRLLTSP